MTCLIEWLLIAIGATTSVHYSQCNVNNACQVVSLEAAENQADKWLICLFSQPDGKLVFIVMQPFADQPWPSSGMHRACRWGCCGLLRSGSPADAMIPALIGHTKPNRVSGESTSFYCLQP
ncbi:hypothetical protein BGW36DRAFT_155775 [Talaromyces proteolyticus]|uniref:Secreted protein n=1 Tax=Talaromyces proteolyticus TaxID=1131652 RepID=A0AAD4KS53_9EURO|nr:uncharacterized protein BGW36DRAFT_155775 [Talaromyces proteolyticus]KAH8699154.1 hypothetical protein BGW36DRAFT_155775 [Talaromyces proteolyticus]